MNVVMKTYALKMEILLNYTMAFNGFQILSHSHVFLEPNSILSSISPSTHFLAAVSKFADPPNLTFEWQVRPVLLDKNPGDGRIPFISTHIF